MRQIFSGLRYLHQRDILHCDIKPENILFEERDEQYYIKLIDFGVARDLATYEEQDVAGTVSSTSLFLARLYVAWTHSGHAWNEVWHLVSWGRVLCTSDWGAPLRRWGRESEIAWLYDLSVQTCEQRGSGAAGVDFKLRFMEASECARSAPWWVVLAVEVWNGRNG